MKGKPQTSADLEVKIISLAELRSHPAQAAVPDIKGDAWQDFLQDVKARGVVEPIRVSTRTATPVVIDGHQRLRAARELNHRAIRAIESSFTDEAEETRCLLGAALKRRHLTANEKIIPGKLYKQTAKEASTPLTPNLGEAESRHARETASRAARDRPGNSPQG